MLLDDPNEPIWEIDAISKEIKRTRRQTHYLLTSGALTGAKKVGGRWVITRGALRAVFAASSTEAVRAA